jgi:hypothetical protein
VIEAFLWGLLGAAFLLVGAWWAYRFHPSRALIAVVMAIGSGLLIGSVAYELIDEALKTQTVGRVGLFVLLGACTLPLAIGLSVVRAARSGRTPVASNRRVRRWGSCSGLSWTASLSRSCLG